MMENLISNAATLESYAIRRLEGYRNEIMKLQEQIRDQKELLDEQGRILMILSNYIHVTDSGDYIKSDYISIETYDAKKIAECFGLNIKRGENHDKG